MAKENDISFKSSLNKLEKAVKGLEEDDIELEKFVDIFTDGIKSAITCQKKLNEAQKKIDIVLKEYEDTQDELKTIDEKDLFSEE